MNPKLSATTSVVKISDSILEFFKTNIREQVRLKVSDDTIMEIVLSLDGTKALDEIAFTYNVDVDSLAHLMSYLDKKGILDHSEPKTDFDEYNKFRRIIHFLADFSESHEHLLSLWNCLRNSTVLIVGLGAVGSWVACNLVQSGVKNLILMDGDTVDVSNLHRQFGYRECDIGKLKVDAIEKRLKEYNDQINIIKSYTFLDSTALNAFDNLTIDLIINCADKPNVDTTSLWVGGYNLHLSLIGQTVIPLKSACVKCFEKQLEEMNRIDTTRIRKLSVKNRKVGSFGPMCSMIASIIGMEAIKVLSGCTAPANLNRRGEFDIYTMNITYHDFVRRDDCEWCGEKGKYSNT